MPPEKIDLVYVIILYNSIKTVTYNIISSDSKETMSKLSFNVEPKTSILDNLTLYEKIDKTVLEKLINSSLLKTTFNNDHAGKIYQNEKQQLNAYLKSMKYGKVPVKYSKTPNNKYGRSNPAKALGLHNIRREIRHTLCVDSMVDIDVVNCHPEMLNQLCEVDKYVKNREEYFTEGMRAYGCSREDIKVLMIIYCYGGGIDKWITKHNIDITKCSPDAVLNDKIREIPMMKAFHDSMALINREISIKNPELCEIVLKNKKQQNKGTHNVFGTVCSFVLQEYELRVLETIYKYCIDKKIVNKGVCVLCADGMMIEKDKYKTELLTIFSDIVRREIGFDLNFTKKEMISGYLDILDSSILEEEDRDTEPKEDENSQNYKRYLEFDVRTDIGAVMFLIKEYPNKFIWVKNKTDEKSKLYSWTGKRWETGTLEFVRFISTVGVKMLEDIRVRARQDMSKGNELLGILETNIMWALKDFKNRSKQINIINSSEAFLVNEDIKFDDNKDIIGFNNGIYDLIKHEFREIQYDDYLTMSCGYDYNPNFDPETMNDMLVLLKSIMPDEGTRNLMLEVMSAGLTGRAIEKFILFNGGGRNGKGLLNEFLQLIYGDYCLIYANVSLLTEKQKTGGNPELASIHNKRIVIMKEPDGDEPLQNSCIKSITGGGNVSGRMLYSNATLVTLCLILIMECNVRPKFKSEPGDAEEDRVVDVLLPNRFTTNEDEIDNVTVFRGDPKYKTTEWKESHRDAFLQILLNSFKNLQKNNYSLTIPKVVAIRTQNYLNQSFPIFELFNTRYVKTGVKTDILKLKDAYGVLKNTDEFNDFTKEQKRKYNQKFFYEFFEKHRNFRGDYVDKCKGMTNFLRGYKEIADAIVDENVVIDDNDIVEE
jgi:phage/plasmid-associated DNA primase